MTDITSANISGVTVPPVAQSEPVKASKRVKKVTAKSVATLQVEFEAKKITIAQLKRYVKGGSLSEDDYFKITAEQYSASPTPTGDRKRSSGIGHNNPPEDIKDKLNKYEPSVKTVDEANAALLADMTIARDAVNALDTSLFATMSIRVADWLSFHVEGLQHYVSNGTSIKLDVPTNRTTDPRQYFEQQAKAAMLEMVPEQERTHSSFATQVPSFIQGAALLMGGIASIGYFVLDTTERRMVVPTDKGTLTMPENVEPFERVVRSVVIPENKYWVKIIDGKGDEKPNKDETPVMLTKHVASLLAMKLWDDDGELEYSLDQKNAAMLGRIEKFASGKLVAQRIRDKAAADKKAKEAEEKARAEKRAAALAAANPNPALVPVDSNAQGQGQPELRKPGETGETEHREGGGVPASVELGTLKEENTHLKRLLTQMRAAMDGKKEAILAVAAEIVGDTTHRLDTISHRGGQLLSVRYNARVRKENQEKGTLPSTEYQRTYINLRRELELFAEYENGEYYMLGTDGERIKNASGNYMKFSAS